MLLPFLWWTPHVVAQGVGQAIDADPVTGDLFIVGRTDRVLPNSTSHDLLRFHANTSFSTSERIATIKGIDVLGMFWHSTR